MSGMRFTRKGAHKPGWTKQQWIEELYSSVRKGATFQVVVPIPPQDLRLFLDWFRESDITSPSEAFMYLWRMSAENPDFQQLRLTHETQALLKNIMSHMVQHSSVMVAELHRQIEEALINHTAHWGTNGHQK